MNLKFVSKKVGKLGNIVVQGTSGRESVELGKDIEVSHAAFVSGMEALNQIKQPFYISAGTALGIIRDNRFIAHDQDIDVEIVSSYKNPVNHEAIIKSFYEHGFILVRTMHDESFPQQLAFINNDDVIFDIWFVYTDVEEGYGVTFSDLGRMKTPVKFIRDMKKSSWIVDGKEYIVRLPNKPEEYCEMRYGSDWRTPKKYKGPWQDDAGNLEL